MITINYKKHPTKAVDKAVPLLNAGGVAVFPTDSCYGMGGRLDSKKAMEDVYSMKERSFDKAVPVLIHALSHLEGYAALSREAHSLVRAFMPGLLTLVVPRGPACPDFLPGNGIGFRIPQHPCPRALCAGTGAPLVGTSANRQGEKEPYTLHEAVEPFKDEAAVALDAGRLPIRPPSTVYEVAKRRIIRKGPVTEQAINEVLANVRVRD